MDVLQLDLVRLPDRLRALAHLLSGRRTVTVGRRLRYYGIMVFVNDTINIILLTMSGKRTDAIGITVISVINLSIIERQLKSPNTSDSDRTSYKPAQRRDSRSVSA